MKKRFFMPVIMLAVLLGLSGCMIAAGSRSPREEQPEMTSLEIILDYMERRYGAAFEFSHTWDSGLGRSFSFLATTESFPGQMLIIEVSNIRDRNRENWEISSSFLAVKHRDATADFLRSLAEEVFGEVVIHHDATRLSLSPDLPPDATLEEFLADASALIRATIEVPESVVTSMEQIDELTNLLTESLARFTISILAVDDHLLGTLDRAAIDEIIRLRSHHHRVIISKFYDGSINVSWPDEIFGGVPTLE